MAAFRGCDHHLRAQHVENVRSVEKVSYAEAIKKVKESMGGRVVSNSEEVGPTPSLGGVPANSFLVDKTAFLAF